MVNSTPPLERYFSNGEVRLHGLDWGGPENATPMILLHGVGGNAWTWAALAPRLRAALGDEYHIVGIDQRGGGDSDKPASGYGIEAFAQDVLAVQDALDGKPMVLVGHSRGGWLAAYLAGSWPERVNRVVLVDPARIRYASTEDADAFYAPVRAGLGPFRSKEAALAFARERETRVRPSPERERTFLAGFDEQPDGSLVGKMPDWVLDQLRQDREADDRLGPVLPNAKMPILLLVATLATEARRQQKLEYSRRMPHARVELVEGTHSLQLDDPDRVAELMVEFLRD